MEKDPGTNSERELPATHSRAGDSAQHSEIDGRDTGSNAGVDLDNVRGGDLRIRDIGLSGPGTAIRVTKSEFGDMDISAVRAGVTPKTISSPTLSNVRAKDITIIGQWLSSAAAPGGEETAVVRHNVTRPPNDLIDRQDERRRIIEALKSDYSVISVHGMGGMGKSALVNSIAWQLVESHRYGPADGNAEHNDMPEFDVIIWCDQSTSRMSLEGLLDTISLVLEDTHAPTLPKLRKSEQVVRNLNRERCLLIIDDFDDSGDMELRSFIARIGPRSKVVVTSRTVYDKDSLFVEVSALDEHSSSELVEKESSRLGIAERVNNENRVLAEFIQATGGNPLAIRLTIGQLRYSSGGLKRVIERLRAGDDPDLFAPIFEHAWEEILADKRGYDLIVAALERHPSTVSTDSLAACLHMTEYQLRKAVERLVDSSLIESVHVGEMYSRRLRLHPLMRAYVAQRTHGSSATAELDDALIDFYLGFATANSEFYKSAEHSSILDLDYRNILHFASLAATKRRSSDAVGFANAMSGFLWSRGYWLDLLHLCENAVRAAEEMRNPAEQARQYAIMGRVRLRRGHVSEARRMLELSDIYLPGDADDDDRRETNRLRGDIAFEIGDLGTAREYFEKVLDAAVSVGDDWDRALTLVELGTCLYQSGEFDDAEERFREAERKNEEMNAKEGLAVTLSHLADALYERSAAEAEQEKASSSAEQAREYWLLGLNLARLVGSPMVEAQCLLGLSKMFVMDSNYRDAGIYAESALRIFTRLGVKEEIEAKLIIDNLADLRPDPELQTISAVMRRCRAIILDFDDTVAATTHTRWPVMRQAAADFGRAVDDDSIRREWGRPFDEMMSALIDFRDEEERADFISRYARLMQDAKPAPARGAVSLIARLRFEGCSQIIVSSGKQSLIEQDLRQLGIADFFDEIYSADNTTVHKPDPEVLRDALKYLVFDKKIPKSEIVYIGDSYRDLRVAQGNGICFIAVLSGSETADDFLSRGQPEALIVPHLSMLSMWIRSAE
ncbi:HAD hydrolase-like protein [Nocardia aurantia]|uniref:Phosphoglycolate phosphatase n=1 Tax=Nocardia aurantia TaxID=2585199 RepID=A0A7K0DQ56_9NOCA|nr:HAD hydrolase-like protein [Nocardia aurantia]MQY27893.1 Phosphoglycolate phosphatase [Nocardia aurantia]